jgi:hypothetical protein
MRLWRGHAEDMSHARILAEHAALQRSNKQVTQAAVHVCQS